MNGGNTKTIATELALKWDFLVGEGPVWDAGRGCFWCTDNAAGRALQIIETPTGWSAGRTYQHSAHLASILPTRSGDLLLAGGSQLSLLDDDGKTRLFATLPCNEEEHVNEAKCDPQGRIWVGTATSSLHLGRAKLFCVLPDGTVQHKLSGLTIGNGMAWSADSRTMYFCDSPTGRIDAFDFDPSSGEISNRHTIIRLKYGEGWGDGLCADVDGNLWIAFPIHGEVRCYTPQGKMLAVVDCIIPFLTSCAFGGSNLDTLLITTASVELPPFLSGAAGFSPAQLQRASAATNGGSLLSAKPGVYGMISPAVNL